MDLSIETEVTGNTVASPRSVDRITRRGGKRCELPFNHGNLLVSDPNKMLSWVLDLTENKLKNIRSFRSYSEIANPMQTNGHETIVDLHINY